MNKSSADVLEAALIAQICINGKQFLKKLGLQF